MEDMLLATLSNCCWYVHLTSIELFTQLICSNQRCLILILNWAPCVVWTSPLVAALGMSLAIPIAMAVDMLIHGLHYSVVYVLGSVQVIMGTSIE